MDVDLTQNILKLWNEPTGRAGFAAYCAACFLGQIGNAIWLWLGKEIDCVVDRFKKDARATIKALLTNFGLIVGIAFLIPFEGVPMSAAIVMGLMQGLSSDSKLNSSARKVWPHDAATGEPIPPKGNPS